MKKTLQIFLSTFIMLKTHCQPAIIPQPVQIGLTGGAWNLPNEIKIMATTGGELAFHLSTLMKKLNATTGYRCQMTDSIDKASIRFIRTSPGSGIPAEGYRLTVAANGVEIKSADPAGFFYGIQSLLQLLPPEIEGTGKADSVNWSIPHLTVTDYPRFGWRGLMLDVSRHFFTVQEVKDFIDQMARYKFNTLHWHLSDDEGWRIEIKQLPKLTSVGAWNVKKTGYFGDFEAPSPGEPRNYGGYYTQEQIRDIVAYASQRFVRILPEIDVPGHSLAAIASYPELSCTKEAINYKVRSGEKIMDWHGHGKFTALIDNTLCPANERVYEFLDKVFSELAQLFPFEFIHVGGDECAKNFWLKSPAIHSLMKREKLKNMDAVQAYFEKRVAHLLEKHGKKMIGWDEIMEGGLPANTAVMSWRSEKAGIAASNAGHQVVMSPTTRAYFDYMQADPVIEPRVYATLRLKTVYGFNPAPPEADQKNILGGQANIWTEQIYNSRHLQYMVWPRAMAIAESVWTPDTEKSWTYFVKKVEKHQPRLDILQIKYAPSMYDPIFEFHRDSAGSLWASLSTEIDDLDIHYSFDNSFPDNFYPRYTQPIRIPEEAYQLRVVTYREKKQMGRMNTITREEMTRRASQPKQN